ncbi:MAG: hypothetical protein KJO24_04805 [Gammaproteobacteria bacterium]|nr:hypothetical protein [Gammaproteobacteria bacterium]
MLRLLLCAILALGGGAQAQDTSHDAEANGVAAAPGLVKPIQVAPIQLEPIPETSVQALVVIPEASGTAKKIYQRVVAGIATNPALHITTLTLTEGADLAWLQQQVDQHAQPIVIAVGNQSYKLCAGLKTDSTLVAGGISGKPNGIPTLSLTGDPAIAIKHIKRLAPDVRELRLVYNEAMNGWWFERANIAGTEAGINVIGYRAQDLKHGVRLYEQMVNDAESKKSAVWIPLRSIVPSKTILPFLLEKAWAKKLAVVSNNPSHTKLGGLLAFYPEHESMGAQLANFALQHHRGDAVADIAGTEDLRLAVNLRTGAHIGLRFSREEQARFDKIFPSRR